mmetsp:Transcript_36007/g.81987  ORF Transcript_36007/g.81987 Transcript_36007/m.81987 type:complete len:262 (+) Transcript_36007:675-1460(+)
MRSCTRCLARARRSISLPHRSSLLLPTTTRSGCTPRICPTGMLATRPASAKKLALMVATLLVSSASINLRRLSNFASPPPTTTSPGLSWRRCAIAQPTSTSRSAFRTASSILCLVSSTMLPPRSLTSRPGSQVPRLTASWCPAQIAWTTRHAGWVSDTDRQPRPSLRLVVTRRSSCTCSTPPCAPPSGPCAASLNASRPPRAWPFPRCCSPSWVAASLSRSSRKPLSTRTRPSRLKRPRRTKRTRPLPQCNVSRLLQHAVV